MSSLLFRPFTHKSLTLANRVVMAPMTRSKSPDGLPGEDVAGYYRRRAEGGVGLIITEGTTIGRPGASSDPKVPNFHADLSLDGWKKVVDEVHAVGGKIAPQLWHVGIQRRPGTGPYPEAKSDAPSGLAGNGKQVGEPMTDEDIADTIEQFAAGAARAKALGFDAVEFHGAHGYLIDQFFWDAVNKRGDSYGGDMLQRTRFAQEIIRESRKRVGEDFVLILRFSQWKTGVYDYKLAPNPDDLQKFLGVLVDAGVDIFHCSTRRFWEPEFPATGSDMNLAGWTKKLTGKPSITVGSVGLSGPDFIGAFQGQQSEVGELAELERRLANDEFDLVAIGRALLHDPNWAKKVQDGKFSELLPFTPAALATLS